MKRAAPERQLQKAVAEYLSRALPPDAFFSSIPGGDGRATRTPGYRAGMPDMVVVYRGHSIFLELKSKTGKITRAQRELHERLCKAGSLTFTVRSVQHAQDACGYYIPLRAKVAA